MPITHDRHHLILECDGLYSGQRCSYAKEYAEHSRSACNEIAALEGWRIAKRSRRLICPICMARRTNGTAGYPVEVEIGGKRVA